MLLLNRPLTERTLRFAFTVLPPLIAAYFYGVGPWLLYLIFGAILAFVGDIGGRPFIRLTFMAVGPVFLLAGSLLGTLALYKHSVLFFYFRCADRFFFFTVYLKIGTVIS